jgi:hypothetical protein
MKAFNYTEVSDFEKNENLASIFVIPFLISDKKVNASINFISDT